MERNLLYVVGKSKFKVDLDIHVPASREKEFSEKYAKRGWGSEKQGDFSVFYSDTVRIETAIRLCRALPEYTKITEMRMFPKDPNASHFYKGPVVVGLDGLLDFIEGRVRLIESRLDKIEKNS